MTMTQSNDYPNLLFSPQVFQDALLRNNLSMCNSAKQKMFEMISLINDYGTDKDYLGKKIEYVSRYDLWEVKWKGSSKTEWRFLIRHISNGQYAVLYCFLKKDEKIPNRIFELACRIADNEGI